VKVTLCTLYSGTVKTVKTLETHIQYLGQRNGEIGLTKDEMHKQGEWAIKQGNFNTQGECVMFEGWRVMEKLEAKRRQSRSLSDTRLPN